MRARVVWWLLGCVVTPVLVSGQGTGAGFGATEALMAPALFQESQSVRRSADPAVGVLRSRSVLMNLDLLGGAGGAAQAPLQLRLNLFPETPFVARLDRIEKTRSGYAWLGKLEGIPLGDVIFVTVNDTVHGSVFLPGAHYRISATGGVAVVDEIDDGYSCPPGTTQCCRTWRSTAWTRSGRPLAKTTDP